MPFTKLHIKVGVLVISLPTKWTMLLLSITASLLARSIVETVGNLTQSKIQKTKQARSVVGSINQKR